MLLIGGYTEPDGKARGISAYDFSPSQGGIHFLGFTPAVNPSYLLTDQKRSIVYSVREKGADAGAAVVAHGVQRGKGRRATFTPLGETALPGCDPCHLAFADDTLLVSSYTSGHLHVVRRQPDGRPGELLQTINLKTRNENRDPHAHCATYVARRNQVLVCDLGDDRLKFYDRGADGTLTPREDLYLAFPDGEGPRHLAVAPDASFAVINGEKCARVHLVDLTADRPYCVTHNNFLPERLLDQSWGAAIRLSANGKMIYVSERTFSVVTTLRVDQQAGKLVMRDSYPSGGEGPRDIILSPAGDWLLTANEQDHTVGVFRVAPKGGLTHYHTFKKVPSPTALAWL